jgi:short-subunit dehydrogenase
MEQATHRPLAVVTGASSGIGLELARQFAEHGFDLIVTAHQDSTAEVSQVGAALGAAVIVVQAVTVTSLLPGPTDTNFFERADMEDTKAGSGKKDDPAQVAKQGFEVMMKGDDKVVAGRFSNKVQVAMTGVMPDKVKAENHRKLSEPGSGNP